MERVRLVLGQTYSQDSMISYVDGREANLSTGTRENIPSNRKAARGNRLLVAVRQDGNFWKETIVVISVFSV